MCQDVSRVDAPVHASVPAAGIPSARSTRNCEARGPGWLISTGAAHLEERKTCSPHFLRKVEMGSSPWQQ